MTLPALADAADFSASATSADLVATSTPAHPDWPLEIDLSPETPARVSRMPLRRVTQGTLAALLGAGSLALGLVLTATLTPRLTGRYIVRPSVAKPVATAHRVSVASAVSRPVVAARSVRPECAPDARDDADEPAHDPASLASASSRSASALRGPDDPAHATPPDATPPRSSEKDGPPQSVADATVEASLPAEPVPPPPRPIAPPPEPPPAAPAPPPASAAEPTTIPAPASTAGEAAPRRLRVRTLSGRTVVARVHGGTGPETHIMLPDGQLGIPDGLTYIDEPFQPDTADAMVEALVDGPYQGFQVHRTPHYILLYQSTEAFARESGRVLENLYKGLIEAFRKFEVSVHEAEFPLVAVIFRTEDDFRAHKRVDPEVQAYYEIYSNRIFFYQTSERDEQAPEVAALRRPQTVAHEGTHQVLQNIGIQPRLAPWPPWLIEGLAEYCSTPLTTKRGTNWGGLGVVNARHLATIRDLADPDSGQVPGNVRAPHIGRPRGMPLVEYLVTKEQLTPTDYSLAWALTHYLAMKKTKEFVGFLKTMSQMPPLQKRTPEDQLAAFRAAFGDNLVKLGRDVDVYLGRLKVKDPLPYYAVMFQQRVPGGIIKRAAIVSQSPSMIRQWLDTVTTRRGEPPVWEAVPYPSRTRAWFTAEQWVRGL